MKANLKTIITIALLFSTYAGIAQKYALLDRRWYRPAILSDTVTRQNLSDGWFPIYKTDLDSLIILVGKFKNLKKDGFDRKFYFSDDFKAGNIRFEIENIKRAYGDGYEINMISTIEIGPNTLKLSDPGNNLTNNQAIIRAFIDYLKLTRKNIQNPKKKKTGGNNPLTG